jgi:hypothetical protein
VKFNTALRLGRVSNLPTVLTNAVAGVALAGGALAAGPLGLLVLAVGLAYTAGMFLNDAFDAEIDAQNQRYRPIPAGDVTRQAVFAWGFAMLGASVILLAVAGLWSGHGWWSGLVGLALALVITGYNWRHKENPFGPALMGMCRVLVYIAAAVAVSGALPQPLWIGAALLMAHVMGLTYVAKREGAGAVGQVWPFICLALPLAYGLYAGIANPLVLPFVAALAIADAIAVRFCLRKGPGDIGRAIPLLIAAISILDAMFIAMQGQTLLACIVALGFPLTLQLQRWVRGT